MSNLEKTTNNFLVKTKKGVDFTTKTVIIASGAIENKLGIEGELEFTNFGVSYCAICDGFLFREKAVAVIGGGYSALEATLYLSNIVHQVYLIHRRADFRAEPEIIAQVRNNPKIKLITNSILVAIKGRTRVEKIIIRRLLSNAEQELLVTAVFPCVGLLPFSNFTHQLKVCDSQDYIKIKEDCSTAIAGLFAAGDVARRNEKKIKQIVTAAAEGAIAAQAVIKYLEKKN